ncbi:MAG: hypothetical protein K5882_05195 [Bacteroidales bacterium]|nr:hypothetical protein [Bacteroidales bacterium]
MVEKPASGVCIITLDTASYGMKSVLWCSSAGVLMVMPSFVEDDDAAM